MAGSGLTVGCGLAGARVLVRFVFAANDLLSVAGNVVALGKFLKGAHTPPPPADGTRVVLRHGGQGATVYYYHFDIHLDGDLCFQVDGQFVDSHNGNTVTLGLSGPIVVGAVKCGFFEEQYSVKKVDVVPEVKPQPTKPPATPKPTPSPTGCPTPAPEATGGTPPVATTKPDVTEATPAPDVTETTPPLAAAEATPAVTLEPRSAECPTSTPASTSTSTSTEATPTATATTESPPTELFPPPESTPPPGGESPTPTPTVVTPSATTSGFPGAPDTSSNIPSPPLGG